MLCIRLCLCVILSFSIQAHATSNIVVVGDSLSAGFGLQKNEVWVDLLAEQIAEENLPYNIINASISGETTIGGQQRLPSLLNNHTPSIVILELGGNDGLRGLNLSVIKQNLEAMITLCQSRDIAVLLVGIRLPPNYGPVYTKRFEQIFFDLAKSKNVPLVPSLLTGLENGLNLFQADGIHPTAQAQPILLENVWQVLSPMLSTQEVTLSRK